MTQKPAALGRVGGPGTPQAPRYAHLQTPAAEEARGSGAGPERVTVEVRRETQMRLAARCTGER